MIKHMINHMMNMGRAKNENIRKLQKSRNMYHLSIPIDIVREMRLKEKQKLVVDYDKRRKRIIIKDWEK